MAFRAGAHLMDMEMVQFHPTGLMAARSQMTGTVLEEGLRGAGGYLYNGLGERFMERYDPVRMERSTRDLVSRASYLEIRAGRGTKNGGVMIDVSHLGAAFVKKQFPGMWARCRDAGFDLGREPVEVSPTAHFMMGGIRIDPTQIAAAIAAATPPGLRIADCRLQIAEGPSHQSAIHGGAGGVGNSAAQGGGPQSAIRVPALREALKTLMWEKVGLVRRKEELEAALAAIPELAECSARAAVAGGPAYNLDWQAWLNLQSFLCVAEMIARSALLRTESRGSHFRDDFPATDNARWLCNTRVVREDQGMQLSVSPVALTRQAPDGAGTRSDGPLG
jgi:succinate dehydrogenase / fumarate reductase flavoprotein subunit/fumarate reductase flavoprotein subunit